MSREAVLARLHALTERELEFTLAGLTSGEQRRVREILRAAQRPSIREASFDALSGLSPWLLKALDRAKAAGGSTRAKLTDATDEVLAEVLARLQASRGGAQISERRSRSKFPSPLALLKMRREFR